MLDQAAEQAIIALAHRFIEAASTRDIEGLRALYAPDMVVWKNTDQLVRSAQSHLSTYEQNTSALHCIRYRDVRIMPFVGGYAQQHVIEADLGEGRQIKFPCCLIVRVRDGKIVRLDEYFDSAALAVTASDR